MLFRSNLNNKWSELIKIRNTCNVSIEEKRASKEIGSSLEADLKIYLNQNLKNLTKNVDFSAPRVFDRATLFLVEVISPEIAFDFC